ncbi:hypothetical protein AMECASPLE_021500 [Ameca splendens]|uniref:Secreted protein n=1 Tax=Ameca splendens TaxID=208324 RepID=A0ABV0XGL6_9TELE
MQPSCFPLCLSISAVGTASRHHFLSSSASVYTLQTLLGSDNELSSCVHMFGYILDRLLYYSEFLPSSHLGQSLQNPIQKKEPLPVRGRNIPKWPG